MECWICGSEAPARELEGRDADTGLQPFRLALCARCGSGSIENPPSDAELGAWYSGDYYGAGPTKFRGPYQWLFDLSARRLAQDIAACAGAREAPRVLDIGCGRGQLLCELRALGFEPFGMERDALAAQARERGLTVFEGELGDAAIPPGGFDVVVIWHVLEHLRDPQRVLQDVARVLKPGGLLVLAVPNAGSWQATLFGRHWFHLDLPRHLHFFAHGPLLDWLAGQGYVLRRSTTFHVVQNLYGFLQSTLNAIAPAAPNRLYRLMRGVRGPREVAEMLGWLILAGIIAPVAVAELVSSAVCRRGASSIVYTVRP